eukprot:499585_1
MSSNSQPTQEQQSSGKQDWMLDSTAMVGIIGAGCAAIGLGTFPPAAAGTTIILPGVVAAGTTVVATSNIGMMAFGIIGVHNYLNYYHEMEKNIGNYKNKKQFKIKKGEHLKQLQKCKQEKKKK